MESVGDPRLAIQILPYAQRVQKLLVNQTGWGSDARCTRHPSGSLREKFDGDSATNTSLWIAGSDLAAPPQGQQWPAAGSAEVAGPHKADSPGWGARWLGGRSASLRWGKAQFPTSRSQSLNLGFVRLSRELYRQTCSHSAIQFVPLMRLE